MWLSGWKVYKYISIRYVLVCGHIFHNNTMRRQQFWLSWNTTGFIKTSTKYVQRCFSLCKVKKVKPNLGALCRVATRMVKIQCIESEIWAKQNSKTMFLAHPSVWCWKWINHVNFRNKDVNANKLLSHAKAANWYVESDWVFVQGCP